MIADDHPLYAEGLKNLLSSNNFEVSRVVDNGEKAVETALQEKPDVVFMDIEMPVLSGIEATRQIKEKLADTKIIILTSFEEGDSLIKAIKAGASGYLLKSLDGEELVRSLRELDKGKNPFSPGLEEYLLDEIRKKENNEEKAEEVTDVLSDTQVEVIRLLIKGFTYQQIGEKIFLSERTIKYHIEQIKERTGLKTQGQLIAYGKEMLS